MSKQVVGRDLRAETDGLGCLTTCWEQLGAAWGQKGVEAAASCSLQSDDCSESGASCAELIHSAILANLQSLTRESQQLFHMCNPPAAPRLHPGNLLL